MIVFGMILSLENRRRTQNIGSIGDKAGNWKLSSWSGLCPQALHFRGCSDPVLTGIISLPSLLSEPASVGGGLCELPTADCGLRLLHSED